MASLRAAGIGGARAATLAMSGLAFIIAAPYATYQLLPAQGDKEVVVSLSIMASALLVGGALLVAPDLRRERDPEEDRRHPPDRWCHLCGNHFLTGPGG